MVRLHPNLDRENANEREIKFEMERRLEAYFTKKHAIYWQWCATCRTWGAVHRHQVASNG